MESREHKRKGGRIGKWRGLCTVIYCSSPLEQAEVAGIKFLSDLETDGKSPFSVEDVPIFPGQITVFNSLSC